MAQLILNPTPLRLFEDHKGGPGPIVINGQNINDKCRTNAIAVSPDGQRMVTASWNIVRLWDMKKGVLLKRLEGHSSSFVNALSVSRDGQLIASGDDKGMLIAWDSNIGESLTQAIKAHSGGISSLAFSPGGSLLATGSEDGMIKLWCTKTWELLGNPTTFRQPGVRNRADQGLFNPDNFRDVLKASVRCVRFSPSGELLAIATHINIQIYDSGTRERIANFEGHTATNKSYNNSLAWMPDGTRFFSAGSSKDPTIREWDTSTWMQVGDPWKGHFKSIRAISLNSNGTLLASASEDNRVRLWRISDRRTIVSFKHPCEVWCIAFSADDRRIISGDQDKISEWPVFEGTWPEDRPKNVPKDDTKDDPKERVMHQVKAQAYSDFKVLAMNSDVRKACIAGGTRAAKIALDQEIDTDANNYTSYANRAFVMARNSDWDRALHDAIKSVRIQPSFSGHISKGIALCGKRQVLAARTAFDLASATEI